MSRHLRFLPLFLLGVAACAPDATSTLPPIQSEVISSRANASRERVAQRLAMALGDPAVRASLKRRLDASHAPEGKLQFQALARADQGVMLSALAARGATSVTELLADLDAARPLELYLPVESHRAAWQGDATLLVATIGQDGEAPVAFDLRGERHVLDRARPPATPVLAIVPQETDFTGGRPALAMSCFDLCDPDGSVGGGGSGPTSAGSSGGLFLTMSHFEGSFESWIKGKPEYEYHVYGVTSDGGAEQLSCTGERAGGPYSWDQNELDWAGSALLLADSDRLRYEAAHPGAVLRVVAYEDDDEACVPRVDANRVAELIASVDAAYRNMTSGKLEPWLIRGLRAAPSTFNLLRALRNFWTTGDDLIGNAVETSIAGWVPGGANWVLKSEGTRTFGWFTTEYRR